MILDAPPTPAPDDTFAREVVKAVIIAGLSAVASGLGAWAVEALKKRCGRAENKGGSDGEEA
jgi:hypothetical protein